MPGLNEADTCRIFITLALQTAGWCDPHWRIAEQYYLQTDRDKEVSASTINTTLKHDQKTT